MIKSGLVQQNYGYGTYPSDHTNENSIFIRPSIPLEPSDREFLPARKMPNVVSDAQRLRTSDILFPRYNFHDLFPPTYPKYNAEGVQVGNDGKPLPPPGAQLGAQPGAQPEAQPEKILLTEAAAQAEGLGPVSSTVSAVLRNMGLSTATVAAALAAPAAQLIYSILQASSTPERDFNQVLAATHAVLPNEVAQVITQGVRAVFDQRVRLDRMFQDAVTHPAARMTGQAAFNAVNQALFAPGGLLGPGFVQYMADAANIGTQGLTFQNMGQMALDGAQAAAETAQGGPVVMSLQRLVLTYLEIIGAAGLATVAPRQARQIAQRWSRDGTLRNVARINYGGM